MLIISFHPPIDWFVYSLERLFLIHGDHWNGRSPESPLNPLLGSSFTSFGCRDLFLQPTSATHSKAYVLNFIITMISDLRFKHLSNDYFLFLPTRCTVPNSTGFKMCWDLSFTSLHLFPFTYTVIISLYIFLTLLFSFLLNLAGEEVWSNPSFHLLYTQAS